MTQPSRTTRPTEFSPEDARLNDWLVDEGDYLSLERRGRARAGRPKQLKVPVRFDMDEPERT